MKNMKANKKRNFYKFHFLNPSGTIWSILCAVKGGRTFKTQEQRDDINCMVCKLSGGEKCRCNSCLATTIFYQLKTLRTKRCCKTAWYAENTQNKESYKMQSCLTTTRTLTHHRVAFERGSQLMEEGKYIGGVPGGGGCHLGEEDLVELLV